MQLGVYPPWQELVGGKLVLPGESCMDPGMEEYRQHQQRRTLERVSAFRQIQGISHVVHLLTGGRDNIGMFKLPETAHVRPVSQGEGRSTVVDAQGKHVVKIVNKETRRAQQVLPHDLEDVKLLVLQLDQGSIGTAGVAFMELHESMMVVGKFDKIHRSIRDLKLAEQSVPIAVKAKLWSAYLYSINKRPFGSGANATIKTRMMDAFRLTVGIRSPVFLKHIGRIAKA